MAKTMIALSEPTVQALERIQARMVKQQGKKPSRTLAVHQIIHMVDRYQSREDETQESFEVFMEDVL